MAGVLDFPKSKSGLDAEAKFTLQFSKILDAGKSDHSGFRKWKVSALAAYCDLGDDWRLSNVRIGLLPSAPGCAPDLALLRRSFPTQSQSGFWRSAGQWRAWWLMSCLMQVSCCWGVTK